MHCYALLSDRWLIARKLTCDVIKYFINLQHSAAVVPGINGLTKMVTCHTLRRKYLWRLNQKFFCFCAQQWLIAVLHDTTFPVDSVIVILKQLHILCSLKLMIKYLQIACVLVYVLL